MRSFSSSSRTVKIYCRPLLFSRPNKPHYCFHSSVRPSVRPSVCPVYILTPNWKTKRRRKTKIGVKVPQACVNRFDRFSDQKVKGYAALITARFSSCNLQSCQQQTSVGLTASATDWLLTDERGKVARVDRRLKSLSDR